MRGLKTLIPGLGRSIKVLADEIDMGTVADRRSTYWYVDPNNGIASDTRSASDNGKSWEHPFATMAAAMVLVHSGDTIFFVGNIKEEVIASNLLEDVTIVGCANRARHADHARDSGTYSFSKGYGGASWREAASHTATKPLLTLRGQAWKLVNFLMVPPSDAAAVKLERNALGDVSEYDASHFSAEDVRFVGGQSGIEDFGGAFNVELKGCTFQASTDGIKSVNSAVDVATGWVIKECRFFNNTHHVRVSAKMWEIKGNTFGYFVTAPAIDLSFLVGNNAAELANVIYNNYLFGAYSNTNYIEGAGNTDEWGGNYNVIAGGVTAAQP